MPLRPAHTGDAPAITRVFQRARDHSLAYLPKLHTDAEDHAFYASTVERGGVTVALEHLELWVFQRNANAVAFYASHGFAIIAGIDGAGNEEHEPDHRMAWSLR